MSNQNKPSAADELHAYIAQNEAQQAAEQASQAAQPVQSASASQQVQTGTTGASSGQNLGATGTVGQAQSTSNAGQTVVAKKRKKGNGLGVTAIVFASINLFFALMSLIYVSLITGQQEAGQVILFVLGGWMVTLYVNPLALVLSGGVLLMCLIFSIVQLTKSRKSLSWVALSLTLIAIIFFAIVAGIAITYGAGAFVSGIK